jgi:WD40 repeat protein
LWDLAKDVVAPTALLDLQKDSYDLSGSSEVLSMAVGRVQARDVVVSGGRDNMVRIRSLGGPPEPNAQWGHHGSVTALAIGPVGGRDVFVSASADGKLRIVDPFGDDERVILAGHPRGVYSLAVGQIDGEDLVVSADIDGVIRIWDSSGLRETVVIPPPLRKAQTTTAGSYLRRHRQYWK